MKIMFFFGMITLTAPSLAQNTDRMIDEMKAHKSGLGFWWAGHNSWISRVVLSLRSFGVADSCSVGCAIRNPILLTRLKTVKQQPAR